MGLRKAVLATVTAFVAIALVAPSIASGAEWWWFDHKQGRYPVSTFKKVVEPGLEGIELTTPKGKTLGPCAGGTESAEKLRMKGELYSKFGGMGEGDLTEYKGTLKSCSTTVPECTVKKIEPTANSTWNLTLTEKASVKWVQISNFGLTVEKTGNCEGLPNEFAITGTIEGTFIEYIAGKVFVSEVEFDEFKVKVGEIELRIDGGLAFGTELTGRAQPKWFAPTYSPAALKGKQLLPFEFERAGYLVKCEEATLTGTASAGNQTISVTPTYGKCATAGLPVTVKTTGCSYLLHLEAKLVAGETYEYLAPTDLKCTEASLVEIEVFANASAHSAGTSLCKFTLGEAGNQGRKTVELVNQGNPSSSEKGWISAEVAIKELTSKRTGSFLCGLENDAKGTLNGSYQITGESGGVEQGIGVFPG